MGVAPDGAPWNTEGRRKGEPVNAVQAVVTAAEEATHVELPIPPGAYGLVAIAVMVGLLFVTYAFRSVGTRH